MNLFLRFPSNEISQWAALYFAEGDDEPQDALRTRAKTAGHLSEADFMSICIWKAPHQQALYEQNTADYIQAVTQTALSTPNERLRIEVLTLLSGVDWPLASAILHFAHPDPYPILDPRALWSMSIPDAATQTYDFAFWWSYTRYCRQIASACSVSMQTLNRALYMYAYEKQPA